MNSHAPSPQDGYSASNNSLCDNNDKKFYIFFQLEKVKVFVESLNRRKEEREEQQKIEQIKERIESYNVLPSVNNNTNEQISHILTKFNKFDLADKVPLLNSQRKFLHETSCKMDTKLESKSTQDVTVFLFSDHILITRPSKGSKKKNRIIKQVCQLNNQSDPYFLNPSQTLCKDA